MITETNFGLGIWLTDREREALKDLPRLQHPGLLTETLRRELAGRIDEEFGLSNIGVDPE